MLDIAFYFTLGGAFLFIVLVLLMCFDFICAGEAVFEAIGNWWKRLTQRD